jgi:hypothetical protein
MSEDEEQPKLRLAVKCQSRLATNLELPVPETPKLAKLETSALSVPVCHTKCQNNKCV